MRGFKESCEKDLDDLWMLALSYFEKRAILSEETLEYLDADPFVLFGIDDPLTQQASINTIIISSKSYFYYNYNV